MHKRGLLDFVPHTVAPIGTAPEVPQAAALFQAQLLQAIPWGHHAELMAKVKDFLVPTLPRGNAYSGIHAS